MGYLRLFKGLLAVSAVILVLNGCHKKAVPTGPVLSNTATNTMTSTQTPQATATVTATYTASQTITDTATASPTKTITITRTATGTITDTCTVSPTATATATATIKLVDHFTIKAPGGAGIVDQVAGVPFSVSITAWADAGETTIACGLTGALAGLQASNDYSQSEYCIFPDRTTFFTNGFTQMNVTMYRASSDMETINLMYGLITGVSNGFRITSGYPAKMLMLVEGMTHMPGRAPGTVMTDYGYVGVPRPEKEGGLFGLTLLLVDDYYNRVTNSAVNYPLISSSDPLAVIDGVLCSSGVYVTVTAGAYTGSAAALYTNTAAGYHDFTASRSGFSDHTTPPIGIYGAADHLNITPAPSVITLGEQISVYYSVRDSFDHSVYSASTEYRVTSTDAGATIDGYPLPHNVSVSHGYGSFIMLFSATGTHTVYMTDTGTPALPAGSNTVDVQ